MNKKYICIKVLKYLENIQPSFVHRVLDIFNTILGFVSLEKLHVIYFLDSLCICNEKMNVYP